jgi:hypothetical protein
MNTSFAINVVVSNLTVYQYAETIYIDANFFEGDMDPVFCPLDEGQTIEADCFTKVQCSCCTACCDSPQNECLARTQPPSTTPTSTPTIPIVTLSPTQIPTRNTTIPSNSSSSPVGSPSAAPVTLSPSEALGVRYSEIRQVLLQVSDTALLDDAESPQYQTMQWIVEDDLAQVPSNEEFILIQRYIISLIFFSMNGPEWWDKLNFLSSSSVCHWNTNGGAGCYCADDATDTVIELSLCKPGFNCLGLLLVTAYVVRRTSPFRFVLKL